MKSRFLRVKKVCLSPEAVFRAGFNSWVRDGQRFVLASEIEGLPEDVVIENVYTEQMPLQFCFIVSHPSFPEIEPGAYPDSLRLSVQHTIFRVTDDVADHCVVATGESFRSG